MERGGRVVASVLCVFAMLFNLLGSVAFAESVHSAAVADGLIDASICHSAPAPADSSDPVGKTAAQPLKCPLCQVSHSGQAAPPVVAVAVAALPAISAAVVAALPDFAVPTLYLAIRPEPRGPPSLA